MADWLEITLIVWSIAGAIIWLFNEHMVIHRWKRALFAVISGPIIVVCSIIAGFWRWMKK
jgi:hypothetical protein